MKGKRREVRRELAQISRAVLDLHRRDVPHEIEACSLCAALTGAGASAAAGVPAGSTSVDRRRPTGVSAG